MYQKWLIGFAVLSLGIVALMEINYQVNHKNYYRHAEDYTVNKLLVQEVNQKRKSVLMGDSVTHWAIEGVSLSDDVYDLTATSSMTIVGQYMLLYRYLQQNEAPEDVYFFFIPEAMMEDTKNTYSVVESIFDKPDEIEVIKMLKNGGFSTGGSYFYDRIRILKFWKQYLAHGSRQLSLKPIMKKLQDKQEETLDIHQKVEDIQMNPVSKHVIRELIKLAKTHNIKLHFILEPLKSDNYISYLNSDIADFLEKNSIPLTDFRKIFIFEDKAFYDGIHLSGVNADTYVYLIDKNIVPILKNKVH